MLRVLVVDALVQCLATIGSDTGLERFVDRNKGLAFFGATLQQIGMLTFAAADYQLPKNIIPRKRKTNCGI